MRAAGISTALLAAAGVVLASAGGDGSSYRWRGKALGLCWEGSPKRVGAAEVDALARLAPNAISQTPFAWMRDPRAPELTFSPGGGWWGESVEGVKVVAGLARERRMATLLKPHVWLHGSWPGEIEMRSEADWKSWFAAYREFALYWARFAAEQGIEGYCIGTELDLTLGRESEWRTLIGEIRGSYSGLLIYAANWSHYEQVPFWDALDAIGVNAYFPLSKKTCPSAGELADAWRPIASKLERLSDRLHLPVVFTEIGYHSGCGAYREPWQWKLAGAKPHPEDQVAGYEAVARVFYDQAWFGGAFWWKWHAARLDEPAPEGDTGFTPQGKPAAEALKREFALRRAR